MMGTTEINQEALRSGIPNEKGPARILVTGGAGFIGSHLVEQLISRGDRVLVVDNFSTGRSVNLANAAGPLLEVLRLDIAELDKLEQLVRDFVPTVVVHLAALVSVARSISEPELSFKSNVEGTFNVFLAAARQCPRPRVVFASSAAVYGATDETPHREDMLLQALSPYAAEKSYSEALARAWSESKGLSSVGLRFFNVYGERQDPTSPYAGVISRFLDCCRKGERPTVYGDGEQTRDFVHVSDVVRAICSSINRLTISQEGAASPGDCAVYNVGTGRPVSIATLLAELKKLRIGALDPTTLPARPGEVRHSVADIALIGEALGWRPEVALDDGLTRLFRWLQAGKES